MGLKNRYDKDVAAGVSKIIRNPNQPIQSPDDVSFNKKNFATSDLDLTDPSPEGGPINVPYTTRLGGIQNGEVKSFSTTQPYTPKKTYIDTLQDPDLIARARDPFR